MHSPPDSTVIGDPLGVVRIRVISPAAGARVTVSVESSGIMEPTRFDATLPIAGRLYTIAPTIAWDFAALARNHQSRPVSVTVGVAIDEAPSIPRVERATLHSINDCPYLVWQTDAAGKVQILPFQWMFAAYVNENHPFNEQIRKRALDAGLVRYFTGYQTGDQKEVVDQVYAIWQVLQDLGFRYSDITPTVAPSRSVATQEVRFVDESIRGTQANCVDGSVLFASLLLQIGIDPVLVLVPHHMFIGFYLDAKHTQIGFLETTALGNPDYRASADSSGLSARFASEPAKATFVQALIVGEKLYRDNVSRFTQGDPQYQLIDVRRARSLGLLPIPYSQEP